MPIQVVGLGMDSEALPELHAGIIDGAQVLVGGKRQLSLFEDHPASKVSITSPLESVFSEIAASEEAGRDVVVLADGDPLFYGIGARLVDEFGPDGVHFYPNVTSLQAAAALAKVPWQEVISVSLHGRDDYVPLYNALRGGSWVAVLTDDRNIPAAIAQRLLDRGAEWFSMWVFENLGSEEEYFDRYPLAKAATKSFSRLNLVLLERKGGPEAPLVMGTPDEAYEADKGLITKWPVRAAGLAALRLESDNVLWDLGAGSGSLGIEACALLPSGEVHAVERNGNRVGMIRENRKRFGALSLEVIHGTLPACLKDLPDPHRVFIGGGLGKDESLLDVVCPRLQDGGRLVIHCVLLGTLERCRHYLTKLGWVVDITMLQSSVTTPLAGDIRLEGLNPVFIIAAEKPGGV
ncbi:precorrin-6y C5,15-methyltransferase (decarboxylating) subunit CbiE [Desulfovibrio mangrovi]|uniref:precorrin-6y C5,15-methyltransferase (decarboxylating) subunit CbiE n=1 Tax=Desulfovibrio mangrovi TaxID=2976983 RepID=UPI0022480F7B|nr:precorrin-6y C5,15-methyltransferase (decarboxylating) subunit CbiE [Desulfovibrio mangrovi]UZP68955.1 precorrin-6y C5,15-methyltransferase (decarboxylating) subunit CbiE [Desulfovibrio mangrovi]